MTDFRPLVWLIAWLPGVPVERPPDPERELQRFPSAEVCEERIEFHRQRGRWLDGQAALYPDHYYAAYWHAAQADDDARLDCWMALRNAQLAAAGRCKVAAFSWTKTDLDLDAAGWLAELRRRIGDDGYRLGLMPLPIAPAFTRPIP